MKIVIIDNYDSFTYNLSHLVKELGAEVTVMRNDSFKLEELKVFDKIILSPGPGIPSEAGLLVGGRYRRIPRLFGSNSYEPGRIYHGTQT